MSSGRDRQRAPRRPRTAGLAISALVACGGAARPPPVPEDAGTTRIAPPVALSVAPAPTVTHPGPQLVVMDEPRIDLPAQESFRLLDAGKGARAALRYTPATGTTAFTAEAQLASRHLEHGAFTAKAALPVIRDGFAITVAADRPGTLALRALTGEATTPGPDTDAYLAPWRTLLQNRRITLALDGRGAFTAPRFNDDPTGVRSARAKDELVQRLLSWIVPLPAEPVAAGASWRVVTILRQGPAAAKQTATYTLISRGPAGWKLHVKLVRVGQDQRLTDPSLPSGTTAELIALFRALEGDVELDPRHPLITGGALEVESRMHVKLQDPGQPATEQIIEDTGSVRFAWCRPVTAAGSGSPAAASGDCPDGFSR